MVLSERQRMNEIWGGEEKRESTQKWSKSTSLLLQTATGFWTRWWQECSIAMLEQQRALYAKCSRHSWSSFCCFVYLKSTLRVDSCTQLKPQIYFDLCKHLKVSWTIYSAFFWINALLVATFILAKQTEKSLMSLMRLWIISTLTFVPKKNQNDETRRDKSRSGPLKRDYQHKAKVDIIHLLTSSCRHIPKLSYISQRLHNSNLIIIRTARKIKISHLLFGVAHTYLGNVKLTHIRASDNLKYADVSGNHIDLLSPVSEVLLRLARF